MSNPVIEAFFLGRAVAEVMGEKLEDAYTNALSEFGKFDAEQRENLRQFMEEVQMRAQQAAASSGYAPNSPNPSYTTASSPEDLQEMLDQLRAEIASLRVELKKYRN
ncbi:MAG TPA: DUF6825 family protein [Xenococcaceae cyanobacterium]